MMFPVAPKSVSMVDRRFGSAAIFDGSFEDVNRRILDLVNELRTSMGLSELEPHEALVRAAEAHSADMAAHNHLSHYGLSDRSTWADRALRAGYPGASLMTVTENVGAGQTSAEMIVSDWMSSPGHRRTMLNPRLQHIGSGACQGSKGWIFWTSDFGLGD